MTLERLIGSIGMRTFVKYYYNFKNHDRNYCIMHFEENFTDKAKSSKIGHAQIIFKNSLEKDVLIKIVNSTRVDEETKRCAKQILKNDFNYID